MTKFFGSESGLVRPALERAKMARHFVTPEGVDLHLQLALASQRAGAFFIDSAIICLFLVAISVILGLIGISSLKIGGIEWVAIIWLLGFFLMRNFYFVFFELSATGATPGKKMLGLRVASRDGSALTSQSVFARNAMRELEFFMPLTVLFAPHEGGETEGWMYIAGFVWAGIFAFFPLFNKDRLRIGDLVGGTWVVLAPKQKLLEDIADASRGVATLFSFTTEQLDAYGVKELHVLETVLRGENDETLKAVAERICSKIGMPYRWDVNDRDFLNAYYVGLRQRLENRLLMGKRRVDKFDI